MRIEVSAPDRRVAERWADSARTVVRGIPGLSDVRDAYAGTQPVVELGLERERIAQRGLTVDEVANTVAGGLGGVEASELRETDRRTPIRVRYAGSANEDLATAFGATVKGVPVGQLVSVREVRDPVEVVRVDQRPVQVIEAAVERGGTAGRSRQSMPRSPECTCHPASPGGSPALTSNSDGRCPSSRLWRFFRSRLMFLVLAGEFASFTTPLLVMLTVPLAGVGGVRALAHGAEPQRGIADRHGGDDRARGQ